MERVATALGTRPMSLYTHVRNRDELVALAARQALSEWSAAVPPDATWDDQLRVWCRSLRDQMVAYPQLTDAMTSHGAFDPSLLEAVAVLSRVLRSAGLDGADLAAALRWVPQTVLGAAVLELSRPGDLQTAGHEAAAILGSLASLSTDDRAEFDDVLPHFVAPDLVDLFDYSIDRLVDGVRAVAHR